MFSHIMFNKKMASKVGICLFRNDLRIHDNEALFVANQKSEALLPLYCFDPCHYEGTYHYKFPKTGGHRLKFLLESIVDLREKLKSIGSNLIVRKGKPEDVIPEIIKTFSSEADVSIFLHKEVTDEETKVEKAIESKLPVAAVWGHTLYHIEDLPFQPKHLPDVYTQFRKRVESDVPVRKLILIPDKLKPLPCSIDPGEIPGFADFNLPRPESDPRTAFPFSGGESAALERLNSYLWETNNVTTYKDTRNGMIGPEFSTKFSPWLAHGCISAKKIYWEIKRYEKERTANQSTYWVIFELLWRDYFYYIGLKYGNKLFFAGGIKGDNVKWKTNEQHFKAWQEGKTGVPYVDANMRELAATGFMSNRGRQNVASFLTKDLQLDWRLGAEWFESLLIDHDVCSNYGNWLYGAGIGNDPRENRKFNVVKQGLDYDEEGNYVRLWVPELAGIKTGRVHCIWTASKVQLETGNVVLGQTYPHPIVLAPEWSKHVNRPGSSSSAPKGSKDYQSPRGRGASATSSRTQHTQYAGQKRGLDFYFSNTKPQ
ncbi:cryptochrome DASH-like isoform X2 [Physella acuta]|uniref:cryptochrome DASH-like isoform X2 n=1 Tax=Physella acuta TaxID=109671 RepID=UPI0027DB18EF|nr:cryptochrome DASH-like isoform X2 [Physella acuta]